LNFFNTNAPGIQAISAVVSVLAIIVLVVITSRYVVLTRKIADAAKKQLEQFTREEQAKRRELLTMIKMLRLHLKTLPVDHSKGEVMREAILWETDDLAELQNLSAEVGLKPGQIAVQAGIWLRQLASMVSDVKAIDPKVGVPWDRFNWGGWDAARQGAEASLKDLWQSVIESKASDYNPDRAYRHSSAGSARSIRRS